MDIIKFKLIAGGRGGIEVTAKEFLSSGKFQIVDDVKRKRKLPLSEDLINEVKKLKYYFLHLTSHWIPVYDQYFDKETYTLLPLELPEPKKAQLVLKELWNKTEVTGAKSSIAGFLLTGKIESIKDKFIDLTTPFVDEDDDFGFFEEAIEVLNKVSKGIGEYILTHQLSIESGKQDLPDDVLTSKSKDEIAALVEQRFMDRGAIIMMSDSNELPDHQDDIILHQSKNGIDKSSIKHAEIIEEEKEEEQPEESSLLEEEFKEYVPQPEKVNIFGPPAAVISGEKSVETIPEDLSNLEYSENTGEGTEINKSEEAW
jgi:hypothetical protein